MVVHGPYPVGEPRVAREVAVALGAGFQVDVVAMRREGEPSAETIDGASVYRLPIEHRRGAGAASVLVEYVAFTALAFLKVAALAIRRGYSVVQVHNPPDFLILTALLPKLLRARIVFDVHDLAPEMFAMRFTGRRGAGISTVILRGFERAATQFADAVITVHEPYRRELIGRGTPEKKVCVVMNTLDERLLPTRPAPDGEGFRVVYHGTITPPYGVELLVAAAGSAVADIPELRLEMYGEGDLLPAVKRLADKLELGTRLETSDRYLPQQEVLEKVAGAAVGVIPNLPTELNRFALSSKLFEYVALGIPVVSADLPTLRAHFSDHEILFFEAGNPDALAHALTAIARDPEAAARRVAAARRRYEEYRWPVSAARYAAVLHALGSPQRPAAKDKA
jgi:glycosyltransferase involved in cell wall biosynthesis